MERAVALTTARRHAVLETERRADGNDPFARAQLRRVADLHRRQVLPVDLEHRDVGLRVHADDLRVVLATIRGLDRDLFGIGHHVRIGQDVTVGADDETRALAARGRQLTARERRRETAEELAEERVVRRDRVVGELLGLAHDRHVDDGRSVLLDERREIRKRSGRCGDGGGRNRCRADRSGLDGVGAARQVARARGERRSA